MSRYARRLTRIRATSNPITVSVTDLGGGSVRFDWTTSLNPNGGWSVGRNGNDSTGYGPWSTVVAGTVRTQTFMYLITGSTYTFTVSDGSHTKTAQITVGAAASGTISSFAANATSNTTMQLSWSYSGATLSGYTLKRGGLTIATIAAGQTTYNDTGLTAGTGYTYTLTGNLQAGGSTSTVSASQTTTGGGGGAVTVTATDLGGGAAIVDWTTSLNPGGGWTVGRDGIDSTGDGPWSTVVAGSTRSQTFQLLVTSSTYTFTVTDGGANTATAQLTIGGGSSNTVSNFAGAATSSTTMHLSWTYSGATLSNYTLKRGGVTIATVAAGQTGYDDSGLTAGTSYTYTLTGNVQAGGTTNTASLTRSTTGGNTATTGIASVTLDDGGLGGYLNARTSLNSNGMHATFYVVSDAFTWSNYMNPSQMQTLASEGHEIGNHTKTHTNLATLSASQINSEFATSQAAIQSQVGVTPTTLAYPYGGFNDTVATEAAKFFSAARTTLGGQNAITGFDRYRLVAFYVQTSTTAADITAAVNSAIANNKWVIFIYHGVVSPVASVDDVTPAQFADHMTAIKNSGITVKTVAQVASGDTTGGGGGGGGSTVTATATDLGNGSVQFDWVTSLTPAGGWTVGRNGNDSTGDGPWSTNVSGATRTQTFNFLVTGTTYTFTVSDGTNTSTAQVTVGAVGANAITSFAASATSNTAIHLSWAYSGATLSNYTLKRGGTTIATVAAGQTTYDDSGLTAGTSYTYTLVGNIQAGGTTNTVSASRSTTGGAATGTWMSGVSCVGVRGEFGTWRGTPLQAGTTWSTVTDNDQNCISAMIQCWQFDPGQEFYDFQGAIDWSPGAVLPSSHSNWSTAAAGGYDNYWIQSLQTCRAKWSRINRNGELFIRFAHEMNGNWYPWSVTAGQINNFITGWRRYVGLKNTYFPEAKMVFGTNGNTSGQSYDWRTLWPGDAYVDVYSTDWYGGHYKYSVVNGQYYDGFGGPIGLEEHRQFALAHGKPIVISEWGVDHTYGTGDDVNYIQFVHDFGVTHGGTGAGNLLYENYFNLSAGYANNFQLFYIGSGDSGSNPNSAARYRNLW